VVSFDGRNCVGCPSTMPAMELDRMKHADQGSVLSCNECGRIVIT
jgi:predicted  nucleic acid-binding Zn-ribbon protein